MMTKKHRENKSVLVTFRLEASEFQPFESLMQKTGLKKSELMRQILTKKCAEVPLERRPTKDLKRLVYLANKTSNNVNQLAKKINIADMAGKMDSKTFQALLNNLISIERAFTLAVEKSK